MRIQNETKYPTVLLRRLICEAHRYVARTEGRMQRWGEVKFIVKRRRIREVTAHDGRLVRFRDYVTGRAVLGGLRSTLVIPCPTAKARDVLWVAWHEIHHLYGFDHRSFPPKPSDAVWEKAVARFPERIAEVEPRRVLRPDVREVRLQQTLVSIARWESKLRRAERALKKLRARRRYYEKALPVAAARKEE